MDNVSAVPYLRIESQSGERLQDKLISSGEMADHDRQ